VLGTLALSFILFVVQFTIEGHRLRREARASKARRLRYKTDNEETKAPELPSSSTASAAKFFHTFLSHVWGTGQDQMRIVKQRLLEMIPDLSVFLDVDDLEEIGDLEGYIDRTSTVLIYCSKGYFTSKNCMRELVSSAAKQKPIIALIDPDASRGGMSLNEVKMQLVEADELYAKWAFNEKPGALRGEALYTHLFAHESIEWNRIGHFQDITMRLIAERLLGADAAGATYVDSEIVSKKLKPLPPPAATFHIYCSELNLGAAELMAEVADKRGFKLKVVEREAREDSRRRSSHTIAVEAIAKEFSSGKKRDELLLMTSNASRLGECSHMLLYLNGQTWTHGVASTALGKELMVAMDLGVDVLLAHEMPGVGGQDVRFGVEFGTFFSCADGATPPELLARGIYSSIAVPLKSGPWREASMALMGMALGMSKDDVADANKDQDLLGIGESNQHRMREVFKAADMRRFATSSASKLKKASNKLQVMAAQSVSLSVASLTADAGSGGLELVSQGASSSMAAEAEHDDIYAAQRSFLATQSLMNDDFKV